ncbi:MAG: hypothetical protein DRI44_01390 [Chlamydiae bacterium]|nr:MAG: hypothetical protein DRI44_01390 [Chlamydiota bacterium]
MNTKLIILGINRSGTKLASLIAAKACGFRFICLEPFRWEDGIDTRIGTDWKDQLLRRDSSVGGIREHRRLPIFPDANIKSKWLENVLTKQGWDLVKFIQIGRCNLYHSICPSALITAVIREPVGLLTSLNGSTIQKEEVANQWHRLKKEINCSDPLPDAGKFLPKDLADCARAYVMLYNYLSMNLPENLIRVAFESLKSDTEWLEKIGNELRIKINKSISIPKIGVSTKSPLSDEQTKYLKDNLTTTYNNFLNEC